MKCKFNTTKTMKRIGSSEKRAASDDAAKRGDSANRKIPDLKTETTPGEVTSHGQSALVDSTLEDDAALLGALSRGLGGFTQAEAELVLREAKTVATDTTAPVEAETTVVEQANNIEENKPDNDQHRAEIPSHAVPSGVYNWAVDVDVPADWDATRDWDYLISDGPMINTAIRENCRAELISYIVNNLEDYHGVLTFAFSYLTGQPYEPHNCVFRHFPLKTKVQLLRELFHTRSRDKGYLERLDDDLKKFIDLETVCVPVLQRYLLAPETVWLRELGHVSDCIVSSFFNFSESMSCEHDDCLRYSSVDRLDPLPQKINV